MADIFKVYSNFLYQGGPVVFILFLISIYLFVLIFAKFKHLFFDMELIQNEYKTNLANIKNDEYYLLNLSSLKCDFKEIVNKDFYIIQTLIALCPVLGLLGTVTVMIEGFCVMAVSGGGDAKSMAGGVSKATIPTMAGMVGAISGIFAFNYLKSKVDRDLELLEDKLPLTSD